MAQEQERDMEKEGDGDILIDGDVIEERRTTQLETESDYVGDKEETP